MSDKSKSSSVSTNIPHQFLEAVRKLGNDRFNYNDIFFALSKPTDRYIWEITPELQPINTYQPFDTGGFPVPSLWNYALLEDNDLGFGIVELHHVGSADVYVFSVLDTTP